MRRREARAVIRSCPDFYDDERINQRPWIAWFDYDSILDEESTEELEGFVEDAPGNSVLLVTVDASHDKYGDNPAERTGRLRTLLGDVVPDRIPRAGLRGPDPFALTLTQLLENYLMSRAANCARPGSYIPAFRLPYRDKAPMVTVGGILPTTDRRERCLRQVRGAGWEGFSDKVIVAPHLTLRELAVLQGELPSGDPLSRADVRALGFDLGEDQIEIYSKFYRHYPAFAQIGT